MQPHPKRDYYEVLGVERTCSAQELKSSFRKLALQFHPDKNEGDKKSEEKFKELSEAYEVLSDPEKRARYDRFGHQAPGGFGPSPFDQGFGGANINDIFEGIFGDIFGGGGRRGRAARSRGTDLRYNLEVSFTEAAFGTEAKVKIPRHKSCDACRGSGAKPGTGPKQCPTCHGTGELRLTQGFFQIARPCGHCQGTGKVVTDPCQACKGAGKVEHESMPLGAQIDVPTLDGKVKMKIPSGTQSGKVFRLKGKGIPSLNGYQRGDQHVRITVEVPEKLTRKQRELLEEFAAISGEDAHPQSKSFFDKVREMFGADEPGQEEDVA